MRMRSYKLSRRLKHRHLMLRQPKLKCHRLRLRVKRKKNHKSRKMLLLKRNNAIKLRKQ